MLAIILGLIGGVFGLVNGPAGFAVGFVIGWCVGAIVVWLIRSLFEAIAFVLIVVFYTIKYVGMALIAVVLGIGYVLFHIGWGAWLLVRFLFMPGDPQPGQRQGERSSRSDRTDGSTGGSGGSAGGGDEEREPRRRRQPLPQAYLDALEILGITDPDIDFAAARSRFLELSRRFAADVGGSSRLQQLINDAWLTVKAHRGWQ